MESILPCLKVVHVSSFMTLSNWGCFWSFSAVIRMVILTDQVSEHSHFDMQSFLSPLVYLEMTESSHFLTSCAAFHGCSHIYINAPLAL